MLHHFQLDPRMILGVGPNATADEIHDAFREKSKKHHPDLGGDEWAFRMVLRAYELLKSSPGGLASGAGVKVDAEEDQSSGPSWSWPRPGPRVRAFTQDWFSFGASEEEGEATDEEGEDVEQKPASNPTQTPPPSEFQTVDAELIWIRFEAPTHAGSVALNHEDRSTLSVCLVVSWPIRRLSARTAEFVGAGESLRRVMEAFEGLDHGFARAVRRRIEDGQFVGWVGFPDVVTAQSAFLGFREALARHGLSVRLQTRDEIIPQNWQA